MENTQLELEEMGPPVFVVETPNFLGLPTDEGEARREKHAGPRKLEVAFRPCYIHGKLHHIVGYDVPMFARGLVKDLEEQDATLIDDAGNEHTCVVVAVTLPHAEVPTRAAFIVAPEEKESVLEYLRGKVAATSKTNPHPML